MELRPYQRETILLMREAFQQGHRNIVLCLPTGAGKTVVFSHMVKLAFEKNTKTLVLTDRTELFKQTIKSLGKVGVPVEEIRPDKKTLYEGGVIFLAMVETFKRRMKKIPWLMPELIIIDEAHKGNFNKILEMFPNSRFIGATATPVGKHFYEKYTHIVQNIDIPQLIEEGYLSHCKAYQMVDDFSDLETKMGEFTNNSLFQHHNKPQLYNGVIEYWKKLAEGKKTIVFNVNIEHTKKMHEQFLAHNISSACITSQTSKEEREATLRAFSSGAFQVLNNCGILTTGYDEPTIECVVMNRATKSLPLWLQCVGRGSRVTETKKEFLLLDFGGNHQRLGLWNEPRTWKLKKYRVGDGVTPTKTCPKCSAVLLNTATQCACGYVYPKEKKINKTGVMVEVHVPKQLVGKRVSDLSIKELIELQRGKKYKPSFVWRVIRSKGIKAIKEYAQLMGYKEGWCYTQKNDLDNCTYTNYLLS